MAETYTLPVPTEIANKQTGKTYRVIPLGLADLLALASHLRDLHLEEAKRQMAGLPIEAVKHFLDQARKEAADIQVGTPVFRGKALGFTGLLHALWLSVRKEDKSFDHADAEALFDQDIVDTCNKASEATGFVIRNPTKPASPAQ